MVIVPKPRVDVPKYNRQPKTSPIFNPDPINCLLYLEESN